MPTSKCKTVWNIIMIVLLFYTATYMPYQTCFIDEETIIGSTLDNLIDAFFICDIFVNFISADYDQDDYLIHDQRKLFYNYLNGWFAFDFIAASQSLLPFIFEAFTQPTAEELAKPQTKEDYSNLLRLLRIPRVSKIMRVFRIFKMIKITKSFKLLGKLKNKVKLSPSMMRLVQGIFTALLFTHIFACIWYLSAKFNDFSEETWVARFGYRDASPEHLYLMSLYWATQTVTTVGYGDMGASTDSEIIISLFWMLFGVAFYSFIIGNFTSIIQGDDQIQAMVDLKIRHLAMLSVRAQIPYELSKQIKTFIENNYELLYNMDEETHMIKMLTPSLRDELLSFIYGRIVKEIKFLRECEDNDFLWHVLPMLKHLTLRKNDVIYFRGDYADEIYFILTGVVILFSAANNPIQEHSDGDMFGASDTLLDLPRLTKAEAKTNLRLMFLTKLMFESLLMDCKDYCFKMIIDSKAERDRQNERIKIIDRMERADPETLSSRAKRSLRKGSIESSNSK